MQLKKKKRIPTTEVLGVGRDSNGLHSDNQFNLIQFIFIYIAPYHNSGYFRADFSYRADLDCTLYILFNIYIIYIIYTEPTFKNKQALCNPGKVRFLFNRLKTFNRQILAHGGGPSALTGIRNRNCHGSLGLLQYN